MAHDNNSTPSRGDGAMPSLSREELRTHLNVARGLYLQELTEELAHAENLKMEIPTSVLRKIERGNALYSDALAELGGLIWQAVMKHDPEHEDIAASRSSPA